MASRASSRAVRSRIRTPSHDLHLHLTSPDLTSPHLHCACVCAGELMTKMDNIWVKSPLVRPQTAPARISQAQAAQRRKQQIYDYWLLQHRDEIEAHR